jgi:hypothetical protein
VIDIVLLGLIVLVHAAVKQAPMPIRDINALAKAIGTAIANSLTRYQAKHPSTPQRNTLTLTLADFESALLHKFPIEPYQQP